MNYSDLLLQRIRELNAELERFDDASSPEQTAQRDQILEALAWYVHKLQMRVLPSAHTANVSPAILEYEMHPAARSSALYERAAAQ